MASYSVHFYITMLIAVTLENRKQAVDQEGSFLIRYFNRNFMEVVFFRTFLL